MFARTRPYRMQFRLRALLVLVLAASIPFAWLRQKLEQGEREQVAVEWVREMGGQVEYASATDWTWIDSRLAPPVKRVELSGPRVRDLAALLGLENLQTLELKFVNTEDLSPLTQLKRVEQLAFLNVDVQDIAAIGELRGLKELVLFCSKVEDVSPLSRLHNLDTLHLLGDRVRDLRPIGEMQSLREITIEFSCRTSLDFSPLANLKNARTLTIATQYRLDNEDELRVYLQNALPNCHIRIF